MSFGGGARTTDADGEANQPVRGAGFVDGQCRLPRRPVTRRTTPSATRKLSTAWSARPGCPHQPDRNDEAKGSTDGRPAA
jgi:hypothetical protein